MNRQQKDPGTYIPTATYSTQTYRDSHRIQPGTGTHHNQVLEHITTRGKRWQEKKIKQCGRREKAEELPAL